MSLLWSYWIQDYISYKHFAPNGAGECRQKSYLRSPGQVFFWNESRPDPFSNASKWSGFVR